MVDALRAGDGERGVSGNAGEKFMSECNHLLVSYNRRKKQCNRSVGIETIVISRSRQQRKSRQPKMLRLTSRRQVFQDIPVLLSSVQCRRGQRK